MTRGIVCIVGRPNVGKSSIFNRLAGDKLAITDDISGVTRDRLYSKCDWLDQEFHIIDTGGIQIEDAPFQSQIKAQALLAVDEADVIILVTDARVGVTSDDEYIMNILNRSGKPVFIAANKVDEKAFIDNVYDFYTLGAQEVFPVSALHGNGIGDLLDEVVKALPEKTHNQYDDTLSFCLIGQPNVGKSSLCNAILGYDRVIVSDIPGTTRDAIDTPFTKDEKNYVVIDTAGIRKQGKIYENAEKYSVLRALKAIDRSSVVVCMLDGTCEINEQDKRIIGYAIDAKKAMVIAINKYDAITKNDKIMKEMETKIYKEFPYLTFVKVVFVSALKKQRIDTLFMAIEEAYANYTRHLSTSVVNEVILDANIVNPAPEIKGTRLKITYATQVAVAPPTFVLFVNDQNAIHFSYERYLENKIREAFNLTGSPIKLILRNKKDL